MNAAQRQAPAHYSLPQLTLTKQDEVAQKFRLYDKNKDGLLDKIEFRSLLKDVFSSHVSTQFLEDAIEETIWRESNVDLTTAKQSISSINDTLSSGDTQRIPAPYTLAGSSSQFTASDVHPFNSQGQKVHPPFTTTSTQPFIPLSKSQTIPPHQSNPPTTVTPLADASPPLIVRPIPPPPQPHKQPPLPPRNTTSQAKPLIAKVPAKKAPAMAHEIAAKAPSTKLQTPAGSNPLSLPQTIEKEPAVRVFPQAQISSHPPLSSTTTIPEEESRAFVEYINTSVAMREDKDVSDILPISTTSTQIYGVVSDGWLLCKLLNAIQPEIIPSSSIKIHPKNAFERIENHSLAIAAARKLGCSTVNIGPEDLLQGKPRLVLGLLWQIIKRDVLSKVSLAQHPEIYKLASSTSALKEISESSPEEVLLKWANHHLQKAQPGMSISNFSKDVKDGTTYTLLMNQIAPNVCNTDALNEANIAKRAEMVVENAKKLDCDRFITASDVINGNAKLNLAFVADLFNKHSGLELPTLEEMEKLKKQNVSLSGILDEAEARLRQILADSQLAYELQQEEILLYRQRKLKEQEQLAEQEAMLRSQLRQEEVLLAQQKRIKEMTLNEQEQYAREEQRKEETRVGIYKISSSSSSRTATVSSNSQATQASLPSYSSYSSSYAPTPYSSSSSSSSHAPASYSSYSSSSAPVTHAPSQSYNSTYSSSNPSSQSAHASYSSAHSASSYSSSFTPTASSYTTTSTYAPTASYTTARTSSGYPSQSTYSASTATAPNPYNIAYPATTPAYPPTTPAYPSSTSSYTTTQTVYTEPAPIASYVITGTSPVISRRRGMFERVGKKIDRAFH